MFGAFGFGQGYFGQGPMIVIVPVDGPIDVIHEDSAVDGIVNAAATQAGPSGLRRRAAQVSGLRGRKPTLTNLE